MDLKTGSDTVGQENISDLNKSLSELEKLISDLVSTQIDDEIGTAM